MEGINPEIKALAEAQRHYTDLRRKVEAKIGPELTADFETAVLLNYRLRPVDPPPDPGTLYVNAEEI